MTDPKKEVKKEEPKKKGLLEKLKETVDDREEQMMILSLYFRQTRHFSLEWCNINSCIC